MSYQVLARKWRPKNFDDVIGQSHVTKSLRNALLRGSVAHAYVMTGTRGIGKTTIARLLAKALRCQNITDSGDPCHQCESCLDFDSGASMNIIEIDGASNNSVDNIRDLIGNIQFLPSVGKMKVYIIDEVHMLSNQAFNALLKTLEEPPAHVVFILATTEPHKLLGTVLSRCVRFDLRHVGLLDLVAHIKKISSDEGIEFEQDALIHQLCKQGKGSVRDTLSLLEQVLSFSTNKKVTEKELVLSLGLARISAIRELSSALFQGNLGVVRTIYRKMIIENVTPKNIVVAFLDHLYELISFVDEPAELIKRELIEPSLLDDLSTSEIFWIYESVAKDASWALESLDPEKTLELVLQKTTLRREFFVSEGPAIGKKKVFNKALITHPSEEPEPEPEPEPESKAKKKCWEGFIEYVRERSAPTAANLEQGNLRSPLAQGDGHLLIDLAFPDEGQVFYDHLNDEDSRERVQVYLSEYFALSSDSVELKVSIMEKSDTDFVSIDERRRIEEEKEIEERRVKFINQPILQEAKKIFNADVDKVVITKK